MNGNYYHPHRPMWRGNVFVVSVCLSLSIYLSVSVRAVTFEADGIETFSLAQW